jgi:signal transduction histidine kinase
MKFNDIIDKSLLFLLSLSLYVVIEPDWSTTDGVFVVLISASFSALISYTRNKTYQYIGTAIFVCLSFFNSKFIFFLAPMAYTWFFEASNAYHLLVLLSFYINMAIYGGFSLLVLIAYGISALIKYRTFNFEKVFNQYITLEDEKKIMTRKLKSQNEKLIGGQDHEIYLATLKERQRIARDVHDHVGHVLSRALLQVGALLAIQPKAQDTKGLLDLKETLDIGMDNIRSSVHNLHDASIDLKNATEQVVKNFGFCEIHLDYQIKSSLDSSLKYAFMAIIKEGLSNIMKHSNASMVSLRLKEHPSFYQLVLSDNGTQKTKTDFSGIGLKNIQGRVEGLKGYLNIKDQKGFELFITIPKVGIK